jgi:hypothetical protein
MPLAYVHFLPDRDAWGRPVDPGYGVEGGGGPDHGLNPDYPSQGGPGGGYPGRPGQGLPRPPWEGRPGHLPARPGGGRPTDPGYGVEDGSAGQLPLFPLEGEGEPGEGGEPGQGLPQEPGTIWPPLPPGHLHGKAVLGCYAWYGGQLHHHFVVVTIPVRPERPTDPGYGIEEGAPGQGLPGQGGRPGQGLPPTGRPPQAGQPLPRPPAGGPGTMPSR